MRDGDCRQPVVHGRYVGEYGMQVAAEEGEWLEGRFKEAASCSEADYYFLDGKVKALEKRVAELSELVKLLSAEIARRDDDDCK